MRNWVWVQEWGREGRGPSRGLACEGSEVGWARLRCPWVVAGPGRGAGGWRQGQGGPRDRPLRAVRLACGDLAGGPPPTGTHSDQTEPGRSCAVDGGWAAAHGHTKWPGLTRQKIPQPEVWQLVQRLNSAQDAQQLEPQQINEKCPLKHQHSQLHSNKSKSHMRNMRAS